jgi:hypothetical protein
MLGWGKKNLKGAENAMLSLGDALVQQLKAER